MANQDELRHFMLIQNELEKRKKIENLQNNFYSFCVHMDPGFFTEGKPHLKVIAEAFQEVADGKVKQLAVSMPPRAGKSYITSLFCAWMLGKYPDGSIMRNSYAAKLAEKFSKDIRDGIIQHDRYREVFSNITVSGAVDNWNINGRTQPAYFCAGVGGPITGFGCETISILDDPIKNIEEALSETVIENVWNWYTSTHMSRLEKGCPEIHIATRWTRKDPIGRLTDPDSEAYKPLMKVISIPALGDNGKSFCEEIKTTAEYTEMKKITDDFIWEAEYMQHPIESKGLLYPMEELKKFTLKELGGKPPDGIIGYTDTADQGTDYLCSLVGKRYGEYTYVTDVVFTQEGVEVTQPLTAQMIIDTQCKYMNVESNSGGKSFADNVKDILKRKIESLRNKGTPESLQQAERIKCCHIYYIQTTQNKETRILMSAGYIKNYFYFRNDYEPGSDYDKFMRQLTSYIKMGRNKNDDAADATTGLAEYMQESFYIPKGKPEGLIGYYTETELHDMVASGKITKFQMREYLKKGVRSWQQG